LVSKQANSNQWSNETKLAAIIETSIMTQAEKAEYCRKKGLYLEQLAQWKVACLSGFNTTPQLDKQQKSDLVSKDKKIRQLEKDLHRKNQALAESAALMVLSKKYRHHFQDEDD
jgi:transposase